MLSTLEQVSKHTPTSMKGHAVCVIINCSEFACHQPNLFVKLETGTLYTKEGQHSKYLWVLPQQGTFPTSQTLLRAPLVM